MIDIDQLYTVEAHEKGAEMQVKNQFGKEIDCFITLAGSDSKLWRESWNKRKSDALDGKDVSVDMIVDISLGWRGFERGGKKIKFSKKGIRDLYESAPYIKTQADFFVGSRENFMKGLEKN